MKYIFITERPTQIITAVLLCKSINLTDNIQIFIANCFENAPEISNRFSEHIPAITFKLVNSYTTAIEIAESELPAHLFIHWDVGVGTQKWLSRLKKKNKQCKISVFEEGIGTYRQNIYSSTKKRLLEIFNYPINVGGSSHIDNIYIYNKENYIRNATKKPKEINQISIQLQDYISENKNKLTTIFSAEKFINQIKSKDNYKCTIYLSDWSLKESALQTISQKKGIKIIKLHPHCKETLTTGDSLIAPNSMPAELLIILLSTIFKQIEVYHHNSSVTLYINLQNVQFIKLNNN